MHIIYCSGQRHAGGRTAVVYAVRIGGEWRYRQAVSPNEDHAEAFTRLEVKAMTSAMNELPGGQSVEIYTLNAVSARIVREKADCAALGLSAAMLQSLRSAIERHKSVTVNVTRRKSAPTLMREVRKMAMAAAQLTDEDIRQMKKTRDMAALAKEETPGTDNQG